MTDLAASRRARARVSIAHKLLLAGLVFALLLFALGACISGNKAATLGGGMTGAAVGALAGGPGGAAVGALAGAAGGDMLVDDPPTSETTINAQPGSTVNVAGMDAPRAWYWDPWYWILAYGVFRFRAGLLAFARSLFTGGFLASGMTLLGMVFGGKVADKAKAAVAEHEERSPRALALSRLKRPPAAVVSSEVGPHA